MDLEVRLKIEDPETVGDADSDAPHFDSKILKNNQERKTFLLLLLSELQFTLLYETSHTGVFKTACCF